jgi:DtxR family Mn-dependent transcriptional regulator
MLDPIITFLAAAALLALFWPRSGLLAQLRKSRRITERVLIEDALKHLYHQEEKGILATIDSLSGALGLARDRVTSLLTKLETQKMIHAQQHGFGLTSEGRAYALRIIRVHRLWERYFAEETGLKATEWHAVAEEREHYTSLEEAEALSKQMGNPLHDPHGDPIPTRNGELPPPLGMPLTDLPVGELARITHIEDEPELLYAQLVAQDLHPGMQIRVLDKSPERIQFIAEGEEIKLAPVAAANITATPLPKGYEVVGPHESLTALKLGERGVVIGISKNCRGMQRRRLMDLGIVPGTEITAELRSPSGNPTAYNIRGAMIALRKEHAHLVHIQRKAAA